MPSEKRGLQRSLLEELQARIEHGRQARETEAAQRAFRYTEPRPGSSRLLRQYARQAGLAARHRARKRHELKIGKTFSLIDEPNGSLKIFSDLVTVARSGTRGIHVDQLDCTDLDLCAGSVLNVLALEAREKLHTRISGRYPKSLRALELVIATGLPKALAIPLPKLEEFYPLDLLEGGQGGDPLRSSEKEKASARVVQYVSQCFARYGYQLLRPGIRHLGTLLTEVLDNAEEHGGGRWWVAGYLRQPSGRPYGDCHLTIFNFGPTLAQTLRESLPASSELRTGIEATVEAHRKGGFFGQGRNKWSEEGLWTLYALQEGVTRFYPDERRGAGTAEMIQAFQEIGQVADKSERPEMCLVSGRTHIRFDAAYPMRQMKIGGVERRILALNADNDLHQPPAAGTIQSLDHFFPGTLISLRFFIDPRYLQKEIRIEYDQNN